MFALSASSNSSFSFFSSSSSPCFSSSCFSSPCFSSSSFSSSSVIPSCCSVSLNDISTDELLRVLFTQFSSSLSSSSLFSSSSSSYCFTKNGNSNSNNDHLDSMMKAISSLYCHSNTNPHSYINKIQSDIKVNLSTTATTPNFSRRNSKQKIEKERKIEENICNSSLFTSCNSVINHPPASLYESGNSKNNKISPFISQHDFLQYSSPTYVSSSTCSSSPSPSPSPSPSSSSLLSSYAHNNCLSYCSSSSTAVSPFFVCSQSNIISSSSSSTSSKFSLSAPSHIPLSSNSNPSSDCLLYLSNESKKKMIRERLLEILKKRGNGWLSFRSVGNDEIIKVLCKKLKLMYVIQEYAEDFAIKKEEVNRYFVCLTEKHFPNLSSNNSISCLFSPSPQSSFIPMCFNSSINSTADDILSYNRKQSHNHKINCDYNIDSHYKKSYENTGNNNNAIHINNNRGITNSNDKINAVNQNEIANILKSIKEENQKQFISSLVHSIQGSDNLFNRNNNHNFNHYNNRNAFEDNSFVGCDNTISNQSYSSSYFTSAKSLSCDVHTNRHEILQEEKRKKEKSEQIYIGNNNMNYLFESNKQINEKDTKYLNETSVNNLDLFMSKNNNNYINNDNNKSDNSSKIEGNSSGNRDSGNTQKCNENNMHSSFSSNCLKSNLFYSFVDFLKNESSSDLVKRDVVQEEFVNERNKSLNAVECNNTFLPCSENSCRHSFSSSSELLLSSCNQLHSNSLQSYIINHNNAINGHLYNNNSNDNNNNKINNNSCIDKNKKEETMEMYHCYHDLLDFKFKENFIKKKMKKEAKRQKEKLNLQINDANNNDNFNINNNEIKNKNLSESSLVNCEYNINNYANNIKNSSDMHNLHNHHNIASENNNISRIKNLKYELNNMNIEEKSNVKKLLSHILNGNNLNDNNNDDNNSNNNSINKNIKLNYNDACKDVLFTCSAAAFSPSIVTYLSPLSVSSSIDVCNNTSISTHFSTSCKEKETYESNSNHHNELFYKRLNDSLRLNDKKSRVEEQTDMCNNHKEKVQLRIKKKTKEDNTSLNEKDEMLCYDLLLNYIFKNKKTKNISDDEYSINNNNSIDYIVNSDMLRNNNNIINYETTTFTSSDNIKSSKQILPSTDVMKEVTLNNNKSFSSPLTVYYSSCDDLSFSSSPLSSFLTPFFSSSYSNSYSHPLSVSPLSLSSPPPSSPSLSSDAPTSFLFSFRNDKGDKIQTQQKQDYTKCSQQEKVASNFSFFDSPCFCLPSLPPTLYETEKA